MRLVLQGTKVQVLCWSHTNLFKNQVKKCCLLNLDRYIYWGLDSCSTKISIEIYKIRIFRFDFRPKLMYMCRVSFLSLYTCFFMYAILYFCFTLRCLDESCLKCFWKIGCQNLSCHELSSCKVFQEFVLELDFIIFNKWLWV